MKMLIGITLGVLVTMWLYEALPKRNREYTLKVTVLKDVNIHNEDDPLWATHMVDYCIEMKDKRGASAYPAFGWKIEVEEREGAE